MEYLRWRAGFETSPVPYRGASAMIADLIAGHVKVSFGEVRQVINTPEFRDRLSKQDMWILGSTPAETAARIAAGSRVWANVIKQTGMKAE